ncbi:MAG: DUF2063 domain-containing protein [Methylomicrobium sp.]
MNAAAPETKIDFRAKQREFAAFIRDPQRNPAPTDVKAERMSIYRELFFNNVESFLSSNFPVLKSLFEPEHWLELTQDFFAKHRCRTPHFSEIPEEFLDYLQNERDNPNDWPFLLELAHYEWVEMALAIAQEEAPETTDESLDLQHSPLMLSPVAWPLVYRYPVHEIAQDSQPLEAPAQPSFLVVYRTPADAVKFLQITASTYRLLEIIGDRQPITAEDCLMQLAAEMSIPDRSPFIERGLQTLRDLADKAIVYRA